MGTTRKRKTTPPTPTTDNDNARKELVEDRETVRALYAVIAAHDAAIRQLAEVTVNLHENVRVVREVLEPLAGTTTDKRVLSALRKLTRLTLDD